MPPSVQSLGGALQHHLRDPRLPLLVCHLRRLCRAHPSRCPVHPIRPPPDRYEKDALVSILRYCHLPPHSPASFSAQLTTVGSYSPYSSGSRTLLPSLFLTSTSFSFSPIAGDPWDSGCPCSLSVEGALTVMDPNCSLSRNPPPPQHPVQCDSFIPVMTSSTLFVILFVASVTVRLSRSTISQARFNLARSKLSTLGHLVILSCMVGERPRASGIIDLLLDSGEGFHSSCLQPPNAALLQR